MSIEFLIEDKAFYMADNFSKLSEFTVKSSPKSYTVSIKNNKSILNELQDEINKNPKNLLFIDKKVFNLYLKDIKIDSNRILLADANEDFKTLDNGLLKLIDFLEKNDFTKADTLYVVGGGIIQDVAAFCGACFKRGIKWVFYPTTLLSMCDSCIGGKTGINYHNVKNQLGLFSAPHSVIVNTEFLKTLSDFDIKSGMGEILKLLITGGKETLKIYKNNVIDGSVKEFENYENLILSSLAVKRAVIKEDEFDFSYRKSMNYGHTFGHAIEILSNYKIPHGQAVIIGMMIANKIAINKNILNIADYNLIQKLSKDLLGKTLMQQVDLSGIDKLLKKDKKTEGNILNLVVISEIGNTKFLQIPIDETFIYETINMIKQEFCNE